MFPGGPSGGIPVRAAAVLAQAPAASNNTGAGTSHADLGAPPLAGALLIICGSANQHGGIALDSANVFVSGGVTQPRPFTKFAADVFTATDPPPYDPCVIAWRIATGDEQHLDLYNGNKFTIYEYRHAGDPTTFEVRQLSQQAASSGKTLGPFVIPGDAQVLALNWGNSASTIAPNQVLDPAYTQDLQVGTGVGGTGHPGTLHAHGSTGGIPRVTSGAVEPWAAMAVGIRRA